MKVKEIMETLNSWLTPEMPVLEAIRIMKQSRRGHGLSVHGIVVLDQEMKLIGIVSTKDILRSLIPSYMFLEGMMDDTSWEVMRIERTEKAKSLTVRDIMTEDVRTIPLNESIMRCADIMLVEQLRRLPVVGTEGRVLGIVYLREVYNAVTNILCDTTTTIETV